MRLPRVNRLPLGGSVVAGAITAVAAISPIKVGRMGTRAAAIPLRTVGPAFGVLALSGRSRRIEAFGRCTQPRLSQRLRLERRQRGVGRSGSVSRAVRIGGLSLGGVRISIAIAPAPAATTPAPSRPAPLVGFAPIVALAVVLLLTVAARRQRCVTSGALGRGTVAGLGRCSIPECSFGRHPIGRCSIARYPIGERALGLDARFPRRRILAWIAALARIRAARRRSVSALRGIGTTRALAVAFALVLDARREIHALRFDARRGVRRRRFGISAARCWSSRSLRLARLARAFHGPEGQGLW